MLVSRRLNRRMPGLIVPGMRIFLLACSKLLQKKRRQGRRSFFYSVLVSVFLM